LGIRDGDVLHGFDRTIPGASLVDAPELTVAVRQNGFRDLMTDAHHRVQRGHGLLEDHGKTPTAQLPNLLLWNLQQVALAAAAFGPQDLSRSLGPRRK